MFLKTCGGGAGNLGGRGPIRRADLILPPMTEPKRLPPEQSRIAALEAARGLLVESGPRAVTLKAVAARMGRTHANLLHHFGSAAELQRALAAHLASIVSESIGEAARADSPRAVVDLTFDAFGREGGGALARWMLRMGNEDALDPVVETIHGVIADSHPREQARGSVRETTLALVLLALGHALLGEQLAESLSVDRETTRDRAAAMLIASLEGDEDLRG